MRILLAIGGLLFGSLFHTLSAQELDYPTSVFDTSLHEGHCINLGSYNGTGLPYPGVDPTGAMDSTAGIQNAIAYMYIQNAGGVPRQETLYFPNGTYLISNTLDAMWTENTTGNTTTGSITVTNLATTTNVRIGNTFVCADFPAGTTVVTVSASTQSITVSNAATGTHTGIATEFEAPDYRLHFVGQSESGVTLTLGNAVAGFTSAATPLPMIKTESDGGTNNAFDNCIWNMTINTGTNNPGAVGIDFLGNNCASVRNVTFTAAANSGYAGLKMTRAYPGPCMIENVVVNGFASGVMVGQAQYGVTFEGLTLNNQTTVGLSNAGNGVFIRNLTSTNSNSVSVPVINNGYSGLLVLVDSTATYTGSDATKANAVNNATLGTSCGGAFVRNFTTTNYAFAVSNPNTGGSNTTLNAPNGTVTEYSTHPVLTPGLPGFSTTSLDLPVQATPHFVDNTFADWYSVCTSTNNLLPDEAAVSGYYPDESTQIQSAIDAAATAGSTTLYFPPGKYYLANPVYLHGSIRRVLGFGSVLMPFVPASGSGAYTGSHAGNLQPLVSVGGGPLGNVSGSVEFDQWTVFPTSATLSPAYYCTLAQNTAQTVTLVDVEMTGGVADSTGNLQTCAYRGMAGVGNLFLDDVDGSGWYFTNPGQQIWARQLNPEGDTLGIPSNYQAKITNTGSTLWILGLKTEDYGTLVESTANAATEVLGGFAYSVNAVGGAHLQSTLNNNLFDVQNADFSGCYITFGGSANPDYPNQLGETEGSQSATIYDYTSASTPTAYLRQESANFSLAPFVVAAPALSVPGMDIGTFGVAGTASISSGVYTIAGAGTTVGGTADSFHFCSEAIAGNCTITAEVTSLPDTTGNSRSGVMIRDTTAANSDMVMCSMLAGRADFTIRSTTGGTSTLYQQTSISAPYWVRLQRSGNTFTSYTSPDGVTWTQLGTAQTFTMGSSAPLVGLGVSSGSTSALCTSTLSNITITSP